MSDTTVFISGFGPVSADAVELDLSDRGLESLPDEVFRLVRLRVLNISGNRIRNLPCAIGNLEELEMLNAAENVLDDLPTSFAMCTEMRRLNISGNRLATVPACIIRLEQLEELKMGANNISRLPSEVSNLRKLRVLFLGGNQLQSLPESLCTLDNLTALNVSGNQLSSLPESMGQLQSLITLSISDNQINTLPASVLHLVSLEDLIAHGNPLVGGNTSNPAAIGHASLLELAARAVYQAHGSGLCNLESLPDEIHEMLTGVNPCQHPGCNDIYFTHRVRKIVRGDIGGAFDLPMHLFACSSHDAVTQCADGNGNVDTGFRHHSEFDAFSEGGKKAVSAHLVSLAHGV